MSKATKCAAAGRSPAFRRRARPSKTLGKKHTAMPNVIANVFLNSGSDLTPLTQGLRGEVSPWGTLPLNNPPFLTALENPIWPTYGFPMCFSSF